MGNSLIGGLYLLLLFALSFAAVYVTKAIYLMILHIKPRVIAPAAVEKKKPPEKIYYLVERKKARVKKVESEPKRIHFS